MTNLRIGGCEGSRDGGKRPPAAGAVVTQVRRQGAGVGAHVVLRLAVSAGGDERRQALVVPILSRNDNRREAPLHSGSGREDGVGPELKARQERPISGRGAREDLLVEVCQINPAESRK